MKNGFALYVGAVPNIEEAVGEAMEQIPGPGAGRRQGQVVNCAFSGGQTRPSDPDARNAPKAHPAAVDEGMLGRPVGDATFAQRNVADRLTRRSNRATQDPQSMQSTGLA